MTMNLIDAARAVLYHARPYSAEEQALRDALKALPKDPVILPRELVDEVLQALGWHADSVDDNQLVADLASYLGAQPAHSKETA